MAKQLVFQYQNATATFDMVKIDRSKLYGYKQLHVVDDKQQVCELATLADDGKTLLGKGGIGLGYLTADGNWSDKTKLRPVDVSGEEIQPVPSSFAAPIALTDACDLDYFLNHDIRLVYLLEPAGVHPELHKKLLDGAIFGFDYSYRGGLTADAGFLIMNPAQQIFLLVGDRARVEYIGFQQLSFSTAETDSESDESTDLMDFGMI